MGVDEQWADGHLTPRRIEDQRCAVCENVWRSNKRVNTIPVAVGLINRMSPRGIYTATATSRTNPSAAETLAGDPVLYQLPVIEARRENPGTLPACL